MVKSLKKLVLLSVLVFVLVFGALMGFGAFAVWYKSTGYREQFHVSLKPQKAPYSATPAAIVMTTGIEPDVSTRSRARLLSNPTRPIRESVSAGKELFLIYCSSCHGISGDGRGIMGSVPYLGQAPEAENQALAEYMSGYLGFRPNVDLNFVQEGPDGDLYYTIANGGEAIMPGFRDALNSFQIWDLINYIKHGLGGQFGG